MTPSGFISRLAGGRLRRAVLVLAGGTAVAQLIVFAAYPVVTRLYTPAEFGVAAGLLALLVLLRPIACLTYDHAIPLPDDEEAATNLITLSVLITLMLSIFLAAIFLVAGGWVVELIAQGQLEAWLWLLVVGLMASGLTLALTGWAIRNREFGAISASRVTQSIGLVTAQITAGIAGMGGAGLVLGDVIGRVVGFLRLSLRLRRVRRQEPSVPTGPWLEYVAVRYKRFPLVGTWPNLMQGFVLQAPLLLLIGFYGATVGGNFALAQRLILAPVALIVGAVGQVFVSEAAEYAQRNRASLQQLFGNSLRKLVRSGVPFIPLLAVLGVFVVPLVFGEPWRDAGVYLAVLSPLYVVQLLTSPFGGALDVLERQDLLLVREFVRAALMVGAVVLANGLGYSALTAVIMVSIAGTLSYAFYGGISWYAVRKA